MPLTMGEKVKICLLYTSIHNTIIALQDETCYYSLVQV